MRILRFLQHARVVLPPLARAVAVIAALAAGAGLSTRAQALTYDFNDATLQGWNNRVWNGSAWIDLAPNATTYAGTLLPASANNGLFVPGGGAVWVSGNTDNHLNTLWLRSPQFYLTATGALTVSMAKGVAHATWTAPMNDSTVPYAATNATGWMGVALRTVSDNKFVLIKPKTSGGSDAWYTTTFTQAELAPYVGVACTLDLINADNGGWGWITMDNVSIPGDASLPGQGKDILSFTFPTYGAATISGANISLTVPYGTAVTALAPTYTLSSLATCDRASGSTQNFSSPVHYVVTAADTTTKDYTVTVNITPVSTAKDILTFGPGATIAGTNITWTVPYGTDLTTLAPGYTVSTFATGSPASGTTRNFTTAQSYTITAQDNSTKVYSVTVNVTPASSAKSILTMDPGGIITGTNILLQAPFGTDLTTLAPTYTLSPFATATPVTGTSGNFTSPQTYTITAQNGSTQTYTVTVAMLPDAPPAINVNYAGGSNPGNAWMNGIYSGDGSARGSATRVAPAAFGGNFWNDFGGSGANSTNLKDSKGLSTGVGLTTSMQAGPWNDWTGLGTNRMLVSGLIASYTSYTNMIALTGLNPAHTYNLYIASLHNTGSPTSTFRVGTVEKSLAYTSVTDWTEGKTHVQFTGLTPAAGGNLTVEAKSTGELVLNGFQLIDTTPQNDITGMTFAPYGAATIAGTNISMTVPYGTNVAALAPTFSMSYGATCVPAPGAARDFSTPVHYIVTASDNSTKDYTVTVTVRPIPDPVFTLTASSTLWDGRQTMTVTPNISNWSLLQAKGGTNLTYKWSVAGVAATKQITAGTPSTVGSLALTRAQGNGPMIVTLVLDNGGWLISQAVTVTVQQPVGDTWVQRVPGASEKPVDGQFFARDDTGKGTLYFNGTQAGSPESVFLNVYAKPGAGAETLVATFRQTLTNGNYAFTVPITAGLIKYRVEYGTTSGGIDSVNPANTVSNLVCGDAYIIEGQSNAEATGPNNGTPPEADFYTSEWIRSYGNSYYGTTTGGWGTAVRTRTWGSANYGMYQIGTWGIDLARTLLEQHGMPICMINGAVGGTRIDQHLRNEANRQDTATIYGRLLTRIVAANLTHGIRGVLWHQGEQDQGREGPYGGDFDYKWYQQNFVDLSAAWKQDYPNLRNYYIYQIWPAACGDTSANDMLRETQRTLPYLFSNMRIMSTLGVVPGSGCHYDLDGYQFMANLMSPLVRQDIYGLNPSAVYTAPDLRKAYFTSAARGEITLEFSQNMAPWIDATKGFFYLDGISGKVASGSVAGKVVKLQLAAASTAKTITYLMGGSWGSAQGNLLYGTNGVAALTFAEVPLKLTAPLGLAATPGASQVALTWSAYAGAAGYTVKRALNPGGPYTEIATTVGTAYADTSVTGGTTYYYVVAASGTVDSAEASATPVSFASWIASKGLPGSPGDADPDSDGIDNALEFVLGGDPDSAANAGALLPVVSQDAGGLHFTFKRKDISEGAVNLSFEWSTGLTFPAANALPVLGVGSPGTPGIDVIIAVTEDNPDAATDTITITVPASKAAGGGRLFGRLRASVP